MMAFVRRSMGIGDADIITSLMMRNENDSKTPRCIDSAAMPLDTLKEYEPRAALSNQLQGFHHEPP